MAEKCEKNALFTPTTVYAVVTHWSTNFVVAAETLNHTTEHIYAVLAGCLQWGHTLSRGG
jgi:hypothetical protein